MGKQINYWLGYSEFLQIAHTALDCGCVIIKPDSEGLIYGKTLDTVTVDQHRYYFYLPEAGALMGQQIPFHNENLARYTAAGNTVIEAGFSLISEKMKKITRSRLYAIPGYYDKSGEYIPRPECLTKTYNRLVRTVKKVAPYTELTDYIISTCDSSYLPSMCKVWPYCLTDLCTAKIIGINRRAGFKCNLSK